MKQKLIKRKKNAAMRRKAKTIKSELNKISYRRLK